MVTTLSPVGAPVARLEDDGDAKDPVVPVLEDGVLGGMSELMSREAVSPV